MWSTRREIPPELLVLVDTHCHLGASQFDLDRKAVIERAQHGGVSHVVVVADSLDSTVQAIQLADTLALSATAGVHPHQASTWNDDVAEEIESLVNHDEVVAVGEAGLDYHYDFSPRDVQRVVFARQLAIASRSDLPVVVHSREADDDMAEMIRDTDARIILHSFSSGPAVFSSGMDIGAYFSFSGMVTFKSWKDLDAVRAIPDDRLLIETDSPYLAPVPHRGKRNEPAFVSDVARRVAEIRGIDFDTIATLTTTNAERCFGQRITTMRERP